MVLENVTSVTDSSLIAGIFDKLANLPGISTLVSILQAVGVVIFVYFIFLIVRIVTQIKHNLNIKKIAENVGEINQKMDKLIGVRKGKK